MPPEKTTDDRSVAYSSNTMNCWDCNRVYDRDHPIEECNQIRINDLEEAVAKLRAELAAHLGRDA